MNSKEFMQWFEQQIKTRWQGLRPSWIELGDWHWRLQEFDTDTLTQAARQHKATEDYRTPSLKKVYEYACKITAARKPPAPRSGEEKKSSGVPEAHTFIMCVAKADNGCGCVGWFVPILIWPFHKTYTAETYRRSAEEQCVMHSRNGRNGVWEIFTGTNHGEMMDRRMKLRGTKPLDLNQLRKRYKKTIGM